VAERAAAVLLSAIALAISIPNISTRSTAAETHGIAVAREPEFWIAAGYVGVAIGFTTAIWVGQKGSVLLRLIGWVGLVGWAVLKLM